MQLSKLLGSTLSFMALLGFHGYILTKFYRRKRRQETFNNNQNKRGQRNQQKVSFSSEENGIINQIIPRLDTKVNQKVARRLSELSFHVSYIKSSNYILLTLSAFCLCHLPMYFHQLFELIRLALYLTIHKIAINLLHIWFYSRLYCRCYQDYQIKACSEYFDTNNMKSYSSLTGYLDIN